jgi:hypothetical protein
MPDWSKIATTVGKAAPILGTIFGGPVGTAAGGVVAAVCSLFGADPADPDDLLAKITADPDALIKLKEFELANRAELEKIALERDRLIYQDISDARGREMEIAKVTGVRDRFQYALAGAIIIGFLVMVYFVIVGGSKIESALAGTLVGYVSAKADQVVVYFFGSSKGSADKSVMLAAKK